jgi:cytidylate kinase
MSVIAISREPHVGGEALAQCVAARLGYRCISRNELMASARWHGTAVERLTAAMNKPPTFWDGLSGERAALLISMRAALCEQVIEGNLVYHGYVGHLLLPGVLHLFRVRVMADIEHRAGIAMAEKNITHEEAITHLRRDDSHRARFIQRVHGVDWNDPHQYDMILNLGRMRVERACDIVAKMAEWEEFRPTAETQKALEDLALASRVAAELVKNHRTMATTVHVTADAGVVTITGTVERPKVLEEVPKVASGVPGVKEVRTAVRLLRYPTVSE